MNKLFLFVCAVLPSLPAQSATLRSSTTLQQPQVRIADLFDDAGPAGERVLGPGPGPGGRIVVEAAQAAAIARQFGVAWRPGSAAERVVIDRPGRLVAREEVIAILRDALTGAGGPADADLDLPGFNAPLVPLDSTPRLAIEQVDYDQSSGRFSATLSVTSVGEPLQSSRLSGRLQEMVTLVVPTHRLAPGTIIRAEDLQTTRMRAVAGRGDVVVDASQAIGQAMRKLATPGQPLPVADLGRPLVVAKGGRVMMLLQSPGLAMAAVGLATEPGSLGDTIAVLNPASGALVDAEVIGPDQVRVSPGTIARPSTRAGTQVSAR